jgi:SAM-dependent methyltransferase
MRGIKGVFEDPRIDHGFQNRLGFFEARRFALNNYLPDAKGLRILDIGCGPGHVTELLPAHVESYLGYDTDERYIDFARRTFGKHGEFRCGEFTAGALGLRKFDVVMTNGLLHHVSDEVGDQLLKQAREVLVGGGRLLALDGCRFDGQNRLDRWMMNNDRGKFVRSPDAYKSLVAKYFDAVQVDVRSDLSLLTYSFAFTTGHTPLEKGEGDRN